jgi:hypothetical protein
MLGGSYSFYNYGGVGDVHVPFVTELLNLNYKEQSRKTLYFEDYCLLEFLSCGLVEI